MAQIIFTHQDESQTAGASSQFTIVIKLVRHQRKCQNDPQQVETRNIK